MSQLGVFGWIRDGVRRAVLLGFSDAIEQVGAPEGHEALSPQLEALLKAVPAAASMAAPALTVAEPERKRLGRSLKQIDRQLRSESA